MVHVGVAVIQGFHEILVWTVDTDVAVVHHLAQTEQIQICIAFGCGKDFRYIPVHKMCDSVSPQRSLEFPVCHAYTGCDTVSHFVQVGKNTTQKVWETWWIHHNLLSAAQCTWANSWRNRRFYGVHVLPYDMTVKGSSINEVRKNLFIYNHKGCPQQHMNRALLQGGHYWGCTTVPYWQLPFPVEWGWTCTEQ